MRTSIGIGAIALIGLLACAADGATLTSSKGSTDPNAGGDTSSDGTDPTADPSAPTTQDPTNTANAPPAAVVSGLAITEIAVFQGVKVDVFKSGQWIASGNAPLVANRPAMIRVYVAPGSSWSSKSVTAELRLIDGTTILPIVRDTKTITTTSSDANVSSTFNLDVPADSLPPGVKIQVALTAADGAVPTGSSDARYPKDGSQQTLGVQTAGTVKVVVVPVKYMADGSGRTPDVSATQLALYKQVMMARYPAADVQVTARAPWSYTSTISGSGSGFSQVLSAVTQLRKTDGAAPDVYYYGALAPASSFNSFCGGGCVTGLSTVVDDPATASFRASVGIGFSGSDSADTMAHEVGHAHGRNHAPCGGAQGVDPQFPYSGGGIGVWGYDVIAKTLVSPTADHDMMGYCPPTWVSDYTYSALFDRISQVNTLTSGTMHATGAAAQADIYRVATVEADGTIAWAYETTLSAEPRGGQAREVRFLSTQGTHVGTHTARFYPYDHLPGGVLVVPPEPLATTKLAAAAWSTVQIQGFANTLAR